MFAVPEFCLSNPINTLSPHFLLSSFFSTFSHISKTITMASRLQQVSGHLTGSNTSANKIGVKSPEDVVIVSALRSAITRARKGGFKDTLPEGK
jgi:hypothetical protein